MAHRVPFVVAELGPDVDPFILHLFAALAEKERAMISVRTSSSKGARRETWGTEAGSARKVALETIGAAADNHAANVLPIISRDQEGGRDHPARDCGRA